MNSYIDSEEEVAEKFCWDPDFTYDPNSSLNYTEIDGDFLSFPPLYCPRGFIRPCARDGWTTKPQISFSVDVDKYEGDKEDLENFKRSLKLVQWFFDKEVEKMGATVSFKPLMFDDRWLTLRTTYKDVSSTICDEAGMQVPIDSLWSRKFFMEGQIKICGMWINEEKAGLVLYLDRGSCVPKEDVVFEPEIVNDTVVIKRKRTPKVVEKEAKEIVKRVIAQNKRGKRSKFLLEEE